MRNILRFAIAVAVGVLAVLPRPSLAGPLNPIPQSQWASLGIYDSVYVPPAGSVPGYWAYFGCAPFKGVFCDLGNTYNPVPSGTAPAFHALLSTVTGQLRPNNFLVRITDKYSTSAPLTMYVVPSHDIADVDEQWGGQILALLPRQAAVAVINTNWLQFRTCPDCGHHMYADDSAALNEATLHLQGLLAATSGFGAPLRTIGVSDSRAGGTMGGAVSDPKTPFNGALMDAPIAGVWSLMPNGKPTQVAPYQPLTGIKKTNTANGVADIDPDYIENGGMLDPPGKIDHYDLCSRSQQIRDWAFSGASYYGPPAVPVIALWAIPDNTVQGQVFVDYFQRTIHAGKGANYRGFLLRHYGHTLLNDIAARLNALSLLEQFIAGQEPGELYTGRETAWSNVALGYTNDELSGLSPQTCPISIGPANGGALGYFNALFDPKDITVVNHNRPPFIFFTGPNPQVTCTGQAYVEHGATAIDWLGKSASVAIDNSAVNTAVPGKYVTTYRATDSNGGGKNMSKRTVIVQASGPPTITFGKPNPAPNSNGWYGQPILSKSGGGVTVEFTVGLDCSGQPVTTTPASYGVPQVGTVFISDEGTHGQAPVVAGDSGVTATDSAGKTFMSPLVLIDQTTPNISGAIAVSPTGYDVLNRAWFNVNVPVSFSAIDLFPNPDDPDDQPSGVASLSLTSPTGGPVMVPGVTVPDPTTGQITLTMEGAGQSATGTAIDLADNSAATSVTGINIDKTKPGVSVSVTPSVLWPPDHRMVSVTIAVTVSDNLALAAQPIVSLTASSSEPDVAPGTAPSGDVNGLDGNTSPVALAPGPFQFNGASISAGSSTSTIQLRAERAGSGPGRIYTIAGLVSDAAGNTTPFSTTVTVPHDQGTPPPTHACGDPTCPLRQ
jgi:hypothetical protein